MPCLLMALSTSGLPVPSSLMVLVFFPVGSSARPRMSLPTDVAGMLPFSYPMAAVYSLTSIRPLGFSSGTNPRAYEVLLALPSFSCPFELR
jgi:hypothetical protein